MSLPGAPLKVFCSYTHEDEALCRQLHAHLRPLERQGLLALWHDRLIAAGTDWAEAIDMHLSTASLILLLISPDFFASDYCYGIEMRTALERHQANEARVLPVLLRPVHWQDAPFAYLQVLPTDGNPITLWRNRDAAWTNVADGIRQVIEELPQFAVAASTNALPRIWNVPYPRNLFFTGRDDLLASLAHRLYAGQPDALSQPQAMSGLGGVGKTQLAVEYAYRHAQNYHAVLWIRADSREMLLSGFVDLANLLHLPERNEPDQGKSVDAVKLWLRSHNKWLLILDNADDLSLLNDFLPSVRPGHILLTTRAHALGGLANRVEVSMLDQQTGMLLLLRRAGLLALDVSLEHAREADLISAQHLWQAFDGLPLAIDQAGAYIEETQCSLQDYLQLFREQRSELLKQRGGVLQDHPDSVSTTLSLSIGAAAQRHAAVVDLLRVCAQLHPDAIPEELFRQGASHLGPTLATTCVDLLAWNRLLATVSAYSLLQRQPVERMLSMHRLVQAVLQDGMPEPEQSVWTEHVIAALETVFPEIEHTTWSACERLVPHVVACMTRTQSWKNPYPSLASLLFKTAGYLADRAQYLEAEPLLQRALRIWEQALDPEHPQVAHSLYNLAELFREQSKYEQAEPLYQRALHIWERVLGLEHLQVAYPLNGLADLYKVQGKYEQAESLLQRALYIREQVLGPEHPQVAHSLTNLADLYREQGKYAEAEPLYQRALRIWERALSPEDLQVAHPLNNLAILYRKQGKYEQAERLYQRALRIREQALGPEHPQVAHPLNNLAELFRAQGKYELAEPLLQRALHIWERVLGPEHLQVTYPLNGLADLYREQGKYELAESLYQRALRIREQVLGPEYPQVAYPLNGLATLYKEQGKYELAEPLYQRALRIREHHLGSRHPETAEVMHDFAVFQEAQGKRDEAKPWYERALTVREQALGQHHPKTIETRTRYVTLLQALDRHEEAAPFEAAQSEQGKSEEERKAHPEE